MVRISAFRGDSRRRLRTRVETVLLTAFLALGVVAWEQFVHARLIGVHEHAAGVAHLVLDAGLAVPVALVSVLLGLRLADRLEFHADRRDRRLARAGTVSLLYSLLMIPSVGMHDVADRLLLHDHGIAAAGPAHGLAAFEHNTSLGALALHGMRDALMAEPLAFLLALAALAATAYLIRAAATRRYRIAAALVAMSTTGIFLTAMPGPAAQASTLTPDPNCSAPGVVNRAYNVDAINLEITVNKYGVNDPGGFMYVLDQNKQAALDFAANAANDPAGTLSTGLRDDVVQPLVIRANLGDCVTVNLTNDLTSGPLDRHGNTTPAPPVSMHVHGVAEQVANAGSAVGNNPDTFAAPGSTVTYQFYVDPSLGEGAHMFHSHGDSRQLQAHGLFGVLDAEPAGSRWLDPYTGAEMDTAPGGASGWTAMIEPPSGPSFREFTIVYHEFGDEKFNMKDFSGRDLPQNDPFTTAYRPCSKALNYRSECFYERLLTLKNNNLPVDESQGYGSYMNGDPATPMPQTYMGDPMKTRLVNAGSEMSHVHHMHGGAIRWRRNPGSDSGNDISGGLEKTPDQNATSIRLDSQTVSPGESYTLEHECGAGGCQQAAGDFLFHCHIAEHYVAGMWGFYRNFDTLQPNMQVLPGRTPPPTAVTSDQLLGRTIPTDSGNKTIVLQSQLTDPSTQIALESLVENEIPPKGVPVDGQDAAVWNWQKVINSGGVPVYYGEPGTSFCWGDFCDKADAGVRPPILFDPTNGRPAWPLLVPHLGQRPPFSPKFHDGAPWLGDTASGTHTDGLCPSGAPVRTYNITAISHALQETSNSNDVDPNGQLFVLSKDIGKVTNTNFTPLAIRADVGDCVHTSLTSALNPTTETGDFSKVNMHIHFVQFDPQASDGVITGLSYEQSVKPFSTENRALSAAAPAGATSITVTNTGRLQVGEFIAIGQGRADIEFNKITAISTSTGVLGLLNPLASAHASGEPAGVEFARSVWYADVDSGTVFWHDHVDGIHSWGHGLFGALIIEPTGATWHNPVDGSLIDSGPVADIEVPSGTSVGAGQTGDFREFMVWLHNNDRYNGAPAGCEMGSINLRAEPFIERTQNTNTYTDGFTDVDNGNQFAQCPKIGSSIDPYTFSSVTHGDPYTPLWRAYAGDPVVIRTIGLVERVGALRITGHRFRPERFNANGALTDAATTGISERFDYILDGGAGGPQHLPGDYLYYSTRSNEFESGAWGIFRVFNTRQPDLEPLPDRTAPPSGPGFPTLSFTGQPPPTATSPGNPCPAGAPARSYEVSAFNATLPLQDRADSNGTIYALTSDEPAIKNGTKPVIPLALRANAGDCLTITFHNDTSNSSSWNDSYSWGSGPTRAGITPGMVEFDPQGSYGAAIGYDPDSSAAPGGTYTYKFYVDQELGPTLFLNLADEDSTLHGGYGALIAEPSGSTYTDPATGSALNSGLAADVHNSTAGSFREFATFLFDNDPIIGHSIMPYNQDVQSGTSEINYTNLPLDNREQHGGDPSLVFDSQVNGDPPPQLLTHAVAGDLVRWRVIVPSGMQPHTWAIDAHCWPWEPLMPGSQVLCGRTLLPGETLDARLIGGAGSPEHAAGDYLFADHRLPFLRAGLWGIFRACPTASACGIRSLS